MTALARLTGITREMVPSVDLVIRAGIRATLGIGVIMTAAWLPESAAPWATFAGKFCLMLAVISLVGHAEGTFAAHAASKIRIEVPRIMVMLAYPFLLVWFAVSLMFRAEHEDEGGMG